MPEQFWHLESRDISSCAQNNRSSSSDILRVHTSINATTALSLAVARQLTMKMNPKVQNNNRTKSTISILSHLKLPTLNLMCLMSVSWHKVREYWASS